MIKFVYLLLIFFPLAGFSQELIDCDQMYSKRGSALLSAQNCYQSLLFSKKISHDVFFDRSFTNLSTAIIFFEKKAEERSILNAALDVLEMVKNVYGENSYYNYWKAVWVSFDALEKDRGKLIPTYLFSQIGNIQNLLKSAAQTDPTIHFYGPHRVLGVLHTQMPKIAGGDKKYAEQMLKTSYTERPFYYSNPYSYANILYINGQNESAQKILTLFIATPNEKYESFPNEAFRSLNPEIVIEKKKAKELLDIINDEE
jgi:hypothetical protein